MKNQLNLSRRFLIPAAKITCIVKINVLIIFNSFENAFGERNSWFVYPKINKSTDSFPKSIFKGFKYYQYVCFKKNNLAEIVLNLMRQQLSIRRPPKKETIQWIHSCFHFNVDWFNWIDLFFQYKLHAHRQIYFLKNMQNSVP